MLKNNLPVVITASDQKYIMGSYLMAWSLIKYQDCRVIVYDLGLDQSSETYKRMLDIGVEFRTFIHREVKPDIAGWQIYNKPFYMLHTMNEIEKFIWIDSDIMLQGSIMPAWDKTDDVLFIPDHGKVIPSNENRSRLDRLIGEARVRWEGSWWPCCCVMGFLSSRDRPIVEEWCKKTQIVNSDRSWFYQISYQDQGIFQHVCPEIELQDGCVWNDMWIPKDMSFQEYCSFPAYGRVVLHFGGKEKPFLKWDQSTDLGNPKE